MQGKNGYKMKTKIRSEFDKIADKSKPWKRVFAFFPVRTEDNFKVFFGHVWKRTTFSFVGPQVEYHTNPEGKEDEFQKEKLNNTVLYGRIPPPPPMPRCRPPPPPRPQKPMQKKRHVCEKCGTSDCLPDDDPIHLLFSLAGAELNPDTILRSCRVRRNMNAASKIAKKDSGGTGPR